MKLPKRFPRFVGWLLLTIVASTARLPAQQPATLRMAHPLWKVQGKSNAVYLLGSIHFCKSDFYPLPKPIEEAYQRSQAVVFEADLGKLESAETQAKLLAAGMYPAGESLSQHVSKDTYSALQTKLHSTGGQPTAFDQFKPWLAAVFLATLELQKLDFDPNQGVDKHFYRKAQSDKKEIVPLETVEFQMGLFTALSKEEQELLLKSTLQDIGRFPEIFGDVIQSWKTGDAKKLEALLLQIMKEYPVIHKKFLTDRNRDWLPRIEKLLQGGKDAFVVVGMAHLVGEGGLADLLKKKGLKVDQQ